MIIFILQHEIIHQRLTYNQTIKLENFNIIEVIINLATLKSSTVLNAYQKIMIKLDNYKQES